MSIEVQSVVKRFGDQVALNSVGFGIEKGQIVGFLGPNGAGKSTMMKVIAGLLEQDAGNVFVSGLSNENVTREYRRKIGYLPEHNPLYLDMYVREYLEMVASLYRLPNKKERVDEMIQLTGLDREKHKMIGALSKGYRQRVGLAQALVHDPEVLILDEPTTGLDPNQILEIRALIANVGKEKTVMLSTHIMQEVEAICERVIILNKGTIVADAPASELSGLKGEREAVVVIEFDKELPSSMLEQLPEVVRVEAINTQWAIYTSGQVDIRKQLFKLAIDQDAAIMHLSRKERGLEGLFHELTSEL